MIKQKITDAITWIKNKIRICGKCQAVYWEYSLCKPCSVCGFGGSYVAVNTFSSWRKAMWKLTIHFVPVFIFRYNPN